MLVVFILDHHRDDVKCECRGESATHVFIMVLENQRNLNVKIE